MIIYQCAECHIILKSKYEDTNPVYVEVEPCPNCINEALADLRSEMEKQPEDVTEFLENEGDDEEISNTISSDGTMEQHTGEEKK
jgi:uncharacterized protein (DUF2225 family)